ncbi:MAG: hypothetical protein ACOCQR_00905 [bacterium]
MSVFDFNTRYPKPISQKEREKIASLPEVNYEEIKDIDDSDKYSWVIVKIGNELKYGRTAYCLKTGIRRSLTREEFYGNSTVD